MLNLILYFSLLFAAATVVPSAGADGQCVPNCTGARDPLECVRGVARSEGGAGAGGRA